MQNLFNFKKWYFDFVTERSEVGYLYFVTLRIGPLRQSWSSLQLYRLNRERYCFQQKSVALSQFPHGARNDTEQDLCFQFQECRGRLHYQPLQPYPPEIVKSNLVGPRHANLSWTIPMPANHVWGTIELKNETVAIAGFGYHDFVEISAFPAQLGIKKMYWGRALAGDWWLVFLSLHHDSGAPWHTLIYMDEHQQDWQARYFDLEEDEGAMRIGFTRGTHQACVHLAKTASIENAAAISKHREPNAMLNHLYRRLSGDLYERKYSGHAELMIGEKRQNGYAIFERVDWLQ